MEGQPVRRFVTGDGHSIPLESLPVPACVLDAEGDVLVANGEWDRVFTYGTEQDPDEGYLDMRRQLRRAAREGGRSGVEVTVRDMAGEPRSFVGHCAPTDIPGVQGPAVLCAFVEITEITHREAQLAFMATHDVLTGLPNRRMFEDSLTRALARARRAGPGALIMLDVDNLKSYNDALGHARGDQALINFSLLLQTHLRAGDMLARIGGDEFGAILEGATLTEAAEIGERMRTAAAEEAFVSEARTYDLGMSAGVVQFDGSEEPGELIEDADSALYEAKNTGRSRVVVRERQVRTRAPDESRMAATIREALLSGEVDLHYQPVVRVSDGSTSYFEVLVRLRPVGGGLLEPVAFLGAAERLGLMPRLTRAILGGAIEALTALEDARLSVNLCGTDLLDRTLPDHIADLLASHGVDSARLSFEVSESVAASHRDALGSWFERIGGLGCHLVLDRFGAGARGLALIAEFPFSQVKLDVSALSRLASEEDGGEYLQAVRRIVEAHGPSVVAARIEDPRVLDRIRDAGFAYVQGYDVGTIRLSPE